MWDHAATLYRLFLLSLICIFLHGPCTPAEAKDDAHPALPRVSGKTAPASRVEFLESTAGAHIVRKRLVNLGKEGREEREKRTYDKCIGPGRREGHCDYLTRCFNEEYHSRFALAMNYTCTVDRTYVGVCCTDHASDLRTNLFGDEEDLSTILPVIIASPEGENEGRIDHAEEASDEKTRSSRRSRGCGTTSRSRTRLVGGRPADPSEWPWMAALLRLGTIQYCGGVLITDRHVLTAAHCVYRMKPPDLKVRLGEYDFTKPEETRALDFAVTEIRAHRDFDYASYENDIAIVKIHRPTVFNGYIWPVCLPPIQYTFENKSAIVTGWGTQYYGGPASTVLMEVSVPIWPQHRCVRRFAQSVPETMMCAGEGGRDACQGDSGGPLLHQLGNGRWVNVGIVSWGIRCGEPGHPGIYTRVNSYLDWIFANAVF